jgi:hypothetical protein
MTQRLVSKKELKSIFGVPYSFAHIARLEAAGPDVLVWPETGHLLPQTRRGILTLMYGPAADRK